MMHQSIQKLINDYQTILDRDPLDQMEDTQSILVRFAQQLATEMGEIVVASPYMEGTRMYFDEKIARRELYSVQDCHTGRTRRPCVGSGRIKR